MKATQQTFRPDTRATYQIRVGGQLDESWSDWLGRFAPTNEQGITTLTRELPDQAALRGVLNRIWDLNLTLVSLERVALRSSDETLIEH